MINSLQITNFQAHLYSTLVFVEGVNVIRGTSHHGKSSIIRAIYWLLMNRPSGDECRNWNDKEKNPVIVNAQLDGNQFVSRIKSKKFNGYKIAGTELKALRGAVPEEIEAITRMTDFNIRNQDDGYFLLTLSAGNVSRKLNEKSGLRDIDLIAKETTRALNELRRALDHTENEIKEKTEKFNALKRITKHERSIESLNELMFKTRPKIRKRESSLSIILQEYRYHIVRRKELAKSLRLEQPVKEIKELLDQRRTINNRCLKLHRIVYDYDYLKKDLKTLSSIVSAEDKLKSIRKLIDKRKEVKERRHQLGMLLERIRTHTHTKIDCEQEISVLQDKLAKERTKLTECPTCGADKKDWKRDII